MANGSRKPCATVLVVRGHVEKYLHSIYKRQMTGRVPPVDGFLGAVIEQCLRPKRTERFRNFAELRGRWRAMLERTTGKKPESPQAQRENGSIWVGEGCSLSNLGRHEEAMNCLDRALAIDPQDL